MDKKRVIGAAVLILSGVLFGAVLVSGFGWVKPSLADVKLGAEKPPVALNMEADAFSKAFINVAEKVTPSIVQITTTSVREQGNNDNFFFFPFRQDQEDRNLERGTGSGVIISADGYIITNNHVIENAEKVTVTLWDKREVEGRVIGTDPLTDVGVIKIDASNLQPAYLGDSDGLRVGQWVMAIGNPMGLNSTVTTGIISALNRGLRLIEDSYGIENFIQTDAAINPGNSGGALVDLKGAVIGINTAIASRTGTYIGYGFAIPIDIASNVAKDLIANGKINRGYIGVQISAVDDALARAMGLDSPKGVIIEAVVEGGAAAEADIKRGDIILKIDGNEVSQPNELQGYIARKTAGTKVTLSIYRDGEYIERQVTLKPRADSDTAENSNKDETDKKETPAKIETLSFEKLGFSVKDLTSAELKQAKVDHGVIITGVERYSNAEDKGLMRSMIITKADRKPVTSVAELKQAVESKKGKALLIEVVLNGTSRFVGLEIPN